MIKVVKLKKENLEDTVKQACEALGNREILIYPTDTLYGLGADSTNTEAIQSIFNLKSRNEGRGIACVFGSLDEIKNCCEVAKEQEHFLRHYLPGPYTFLLKPKQPVVVNPKLIDKKRGTIGVRIPHHPFTQKLAEMFQKPFTATSANRSGLPSPKTSEEVKKYLLKYIEMSLPTQKRRVDPQDCFVVRPSRTPRNDILFVDGGTLAGQPSTVIDLAKTPPEVVRHGAGMFLPNKY